MYEEIKTECDQEKFKEVFLNTTGKFEFHYNSPTGLETRYFFLKEENGVKKAIGTAEINPFFPLKNSIVQPYTDTDLANHAKIKGFEQETYEIGKLCIQDEYQGLGYLKTLFLIIFDHQQKTNAKQYISQMVLPLYTMFTEGFGINLHVLGEPDNDKVPGIPVLLDVEETLENLKVQRILRRHLKLIM